MSSVQQVKSGIVVGYPVLGGRVWKNLAHLNFQTGLEKAPGRNVSLRLRRVDQIHRDQLSTIGGPAIDPDGKRESICIDRLTSA